jgi:hypothetical protein
MIGRLMDWLRARPDKSEPAGLSPEDERRQNNLLSYADHTTREIVEKVELVNVLFEQKIRQQQMERDHEHG